MKNTNKKKKNYISKMKLNKSVEWVHAYHQ